MRGFRREARSAAGRCEGAGRRGRRSAFTLVELLVVIFIVLALSLLSLPLIAPTLEGREVREASRLLTSYLAGARSEALKTGRPVGVWFERMEGLPEACVRVSRCKVPPPYAGETLTSRVFVRVLDMFSPPLNAVIPISDTAWLDYVNGEPHPRIQPGDLVRFDYKGHYYRLEFDTNAGQWYIGRQVGGNWIMNSDTAVMPFESPPLGIAYQVIRQPQGTGIARSGQTLDLPEGIVIDLNFSGDDDLPFVVRGGTSDPHVGTFAPISTPIVILFAPDGSVQQIYRNSTGGAWESKRPRGPIYFLLGRRERVPAPLTEADLSEIELQSAGTQAEEEQFIQEQIDRYNFLDLNNIWVTVHPQTGSITSNEVAAPDTLIVDADPDQLPIATRVSQSRAFARSGSTMGGQ